MNWEEFRKEIDAPINGEQNFATQFSRMAVLSYNTHMNNVALHKQVLTLEDDIDKMKSNINDLRTDICELSNIILKLAL